MRCLSVHTFSDLLPTALPVHPVRGVVKYDEQRYLVVSRVPGTGVDQRTVTTCKAHVHDEVRQCFSIRKILTLLALIAELRRELLVRLQQAARRAAIARVGQMMPVQARYSVMLSLHPCSCVDAGSLGQ